MAKERIDLELGGKYSLGDAFKQMNADLSKAQKSVRNFSKGGGDVLRELSGAFDGELGGAISKVSGLLGKIVQGGIFGALGAAASAAVGMMVNHFKEAAEKAKHMAEVLQAEVVVGMTNVGVKVAELSKSMKDAEKDAEGFLKVLNGEVEAQAKYDIARLKIETLQKMADAQTEKDKALIKALGDAEAAIIRQTSAVDQAANGYKAANEARARAEDNLKAAADNLAEAQAKAAEFAERNAAKLERLEKLRTDAALTEEQLRDMGLSLADARKFHALALVKLKDAEEELKPLLDQQKQITDGLNKAKEANVEATKNLTEQEHRVAEAGQKEEVAKLELTAAEMQKAEIARRAAEKEAQIAEQKAYDAVIDEEKLEWRRKIEKACDVAKIDQYEIIDVLNKLYEEGAEEEEIKNELTKKYNELLERKKKAEAEAVKNQEKANKDAKSGKSSSPKNATFVKVDIAGIGKGVESALGWQGWQNKHREDQRAVRNAKNEMKIDQAPMTRFLRGDMPKGQASIFMDYLKRKYTPQQIEELGKLAMKTQLLSKREARQQVSDIKSIAETIKKALAIQ